MKNCWKAWAEKLLSWEKNTQRLAMFTITAVVAYFLGFKRKYENKAFVSLKLSQLFQLWSKNDFRVMANVMVAPNKKNKQNNQIKWEKYGIAPGWTVKIFCIAYFWGLSSFKQSFLHLEQILSYMNFYFVNLASFFLSWEFFISYEVCMNLGKYLIDLLPKFAWNVQT